MNEGRLDAVGASLFGAAVVWTLVAAVASGGNPVPAAAIYLAAGATLLGTRRMAPERRRLVPVVVLAVAVVLALPDAARLARGLPGAGPFGYGNANAAFYLQAALAGGLVVLSWGSQALRIAGALAAVLCAGIAVQGSRAGGVLVAVAGLGFLALGGRWRTRSLVLVLAALFVAALAVPVLAGAAYAEGRRGGSVGRAVRAFDERRVALWSDAVSVARVHPWVGLGPGSFSEESPTAASDSDARWAHDDFLQAAAEGGVLAGVVLALLFVWGLALAWPGDGREGAALGAAAVAVLGIQASVDHLLGYPLIPLAAAALAGSAGPPGAGRREIRPVPLVRKLIKAGVLPLGFVPRRADGDLAILLYHRVGAGDREVDLDVASFEAHLARLTETGAVRSLEEATADGVRGGVVVTVDDGYSDFHEHVLPLVDRYRVPVVLYLATGLVREEGARHADALTWSQLREAVATGLVTVGSHTHDHADLSRATRVQAKEEMRRSKEIVEDRLQLPCRHFAFPFAVGSPEAQAAVRELFDTAAVGWKTNRAGRVDVHRLGRTPVLRSDGRLFFRAKVSGLLDKEALVYRAFRRGPWRYS